MTCRPHIKVNYLAFLMFAGILFGTHVEAQDKSLWKILGNVTYGTRMDPELDFEVEYPVFSEEAKSWEGREVVVKGYMIPLEELTGQNYFVLSQFPYAMCFFCGGAGPETVMEVYTQKEIKYRENPVRIKGKLRLNEDDFNHLMYILEEAVEVE